MGPKPVKHNRLKNFDQQISIKSQHSSGESSIEQEFEYTRDKLLGAVEKVRSGYLLLNRNSPYRHSIEGFF